MFSVAIFFIENLVRKVTTNQWNLFYTAKSGRYHSSKKQPFLSEISLYNPSGLTVEVCANLIFYFVFNR